MSREEHVAIRSTDHDFPAGLLQQSVAQGFSETELASFVSQTQVDYSFRNLCKTCVKLKTKPTCNSNPTLAFAANLCFPILLRQALQCGGFYSPSSAPAAASCRHTGCLLLPAGFESCAVNRCHTCAFVNVFWSRLCRATEG